MPRSMRAPSLELRSARLKLPINKKPVWVRIGHGVSLGYRRNRGPGAWTLRVADGKGGHWTKALATADDFDTANGAAILDFWKRKIARGQWVFPPDMVTVAPSSRPFGKR